MSSINSAERSRQTDEVRRAREEYETRENENAKRARAERKHREEQHQADLENVKKEYEEQISTLRNKNKESLVARDYQHQEQVDRIKNLYLEQVRRKTNEHESARNELRRTLESEIEKQDQVHGQQQTNLKDAFARGMKERDERFSEFAEESRDKVSKTIEDRTQKLNEKHSKEMGALVEDRDRRLSETYSQANKSRKLHESQTKEQDRRYQDLIKRRDNHWENVFQTQEKMNNTLVDNKHEVLKAARNKMQDDYLAAIDRKEQEADSSREHTKAQVESRLDSSVRKMAAELREVQNDRTVEMITNRRLRDLERKGLQEAHQARLEVLDRERKQVYDSVNDEARGHIQNVIERTDKLMQASNRENKMQQNITTMRAREDRGQLEAEMESRLDQAGVQSDKRIRRVMQDTSEAQRVQQKYHETNMEQIKNAYSDNLQAQRETQFDMLNKVRIQSEKKIKELELQHTKKTDDLIAAYEAKIEKVREDARSEKDRMVNAYEGRLKQRDKAHEADKETQVIRYETKMAQMDEMRQKELERIERRTQEQLTAMNNRMKAYNKKV